MNSSAQRGRLIFFVVASFLILERLIIAGFAIWSVGKQQVAWTSVIMPLTHIAVLVFLWITADQLIYLLILLWGIITGGTYFYLERANLSQITTSLQTQIRIGLAAFHFLVILLFLLPSVRLYLAGRREVFEEMEEEKLANAPPAPFENLSDPGDLPSPKQ